MKPWPADPRVMGDDPIEPLQAAYGRVMRGKPAAYDGFDIGAPEKATAIGPVRVFEIMAENRHGMLERVLWLALQIGVEQGRRRQRGDLYHALERLVTDAQRAGADVDWFRQTWMEETGMPWPEAKR